MYLQWVVWIWHETSPSANVGAPPPADSMSAYQMCPLPGWDGSTWTHLMNQVRSEPPSWGPGWIDASDFVSMVATSCPAAGSFTIEAPVRSRLSSAAVYEPFAE